MFVDESVIGRMVQLERVVKEYKNTSDKYILNSDDLCDAFQRQYFNSYTARLEVLKPRILEAAKPKGALNILVC